MTAVHSLFFVVESPFSHRDWQRYGIDALANRFDVHIIDLSPISQPTLYALRSASSVSDQRVKVLNNLTELGVVFQNTSGGTVVTNVGLGKARHALFQVARAHGLLIAEFELGAMPVVDSSSTRFSQRVRQRVRQLPSIAQLPKAILEGLQRRDFSADIPDVFYRCGRRARGRHPDLGSSIVDVHSFDFEQAQDVHHDKTDPERRRVVYLDQNLAFHSDLPGLGLRHPVSANAFYPLINQYFDWLEREHGLHVVVCPHPRAETAATARRFPGREISQFPTASEVARCFAVCGHVSTSFSFAVIFHKPTLILTTSEMSRSWYRPYVDGFATELNAPLVNLSERSTWTTPTSSISLRQSDAYTSYMANYLKSYDGPAKRLWEIIGDDIDQRLSA